MGGILLWKQKQISINEITSSFGFNSVKTPPKNDQHNQFESNLYGKVQNIEFKKVSWNFQVRLSDDIRNIKKNPKLLIPAD